MCYYAHPELISQPRSFAETTTALPTIDKSKGAALALGARYAGGERWCCYQRSGQNAAHVHGAGKGVGGKPFKHAGEISFA